MVQSRLLKSVKTGLILLNINFIILGFVLIIFGISEKGNVEKYENIIQKSNSSIGLPPLPSNFLITMGVLSILTGGYGLKGIDNNYCLVTSYAVFVCLFSLFHASIGISASFLEENAHKALEVGLVKSISAYNRSEENSWDLMQKELKCCGVYNYEDWSSGIGIGEFSKQNPDYKQYKDQAVVGIPATCFHHDSITEEELNSINFVDENVYTEGCLSKSVSDIGFNKLQRIGFILAIGNLLAGIASSIMAHHIRLKRIHFHQHLNQISNNKL